MQCHLVLVMQQAMEGYGHLKPAVCLPQVCKRWQSILKNPGLGSELWREVIIDFGHELITAVHTPIAWSDRRPSDEEFRCATL